MLIGLQRHGETEGVQGFNGSTDNPLTPEGWSQMWSAAEQRDWDRIVTSPLTRCAEFSRALGRRRSIPYALDTRLQEMHFGAWEGRTAADLMRTDADALSRFWDNPMRYSPPEGEVLKSFAERVLAAWDDLVDTQSGGHTLCVAHGGVIRVILCHVLGHPIERLMEIEAAKGSLWSVRVDHDAEPVYASVNHEVS